MSLTEETWDTSVPVGVLLDFLPNNFLVFLFSSFFAFLFFVGGTRGTVAVVAGAGPEAGVPPPIDTGVGTGVGVGAEGAAAPDLLSDCGFSLPRRGGAATGIGAGTEVGVGWLIAVMSWSFSRAQA